MRDKRGDGKVKLECIKDVIMNITSDRAFTEGLTYEGYRHTNPDSFDETLCAKNNFGMGHHIKDYPDLGDNEFFDKHFKIISESNYFDEARKLLPLSNCLKRHYACVIVRGGHIIAKGYNKSLTGCTTCAREDIEHNVGDYAECKSIHAEQMAMIGTEESLYGAELYLVCSDEVDPIPCPTCKKMMEFAGVIQAREVK